MAARIRALVGRFVTSTYRPDALFSFAFPLCFNDFHLTARCCQWHRMRSRAIGMLSNCPVLLRSTPMEFYQTCRIFSTRIIEIWYRIRIPTVAVYSTRTERGLLQRCFAGIVRKVDTNFRKSLNRATSASHLAALRCNFYRQLATREKKRGRRHGQEQGRWTRWVETKEKEDYRGL